MKKQPKEDRAPAIGSPVFGSNCNQHDDNRRLSIMKRSQRVSSLRPGRSGYPHSTIKTENYHKHIPSENPEPARMKQLISWLFRHNIEKQTCYNNVVLEVAKEAEEQLLKDLQGGELDINWYNNQKKEDSTKVVANPINAKLKRELAEVTEDCKRMKKEIHLLDSTLKEEVSVLKSKLAASDTSEFDLGEAWLSKLKELEDFQIPIISSDDIDALRKLEQNTDRLSKTLAHVVRQQSNMVEDCNKVSATINNFSQDPILSNVDPYFVLKSLQRQLPPYFPF